MTTTVLVAEATPTLVSVGGPEQVVITASAPSAPVSVATVSQPATTITVVPASVVTISTPQEQGPRGPAGPMGGTPSLPASTPLSGHMVVKIDGPTGVAYASNTVVTDAYKVVGMTNQAYGSGDVATILSSGLIEFGGWAWTPGNPVFLGVNGLPTQTLDPSATFTLMLGIALTPTSVYLSIQSPIINS